MIIAGGGTGGHVFPGITVAKKFMDADRKNGVLYVGARGGMEETIVPKYGLDFKLLELGGIKGKGVIRKVLNLCKVFKGIFSSMKIIKGYGPDVVFGVGGYASYPTIFAARLLGKKTAVLEQNAVAGLANRVLGRLVDRVYTVFDYTERFFPKDKVLLTGNPIRTDIADVGKDPKPREEVLTVLVIGGSQGASNINKRMAESLDGLADVKSRLVFIHQSGKRDVEFVRNAYEAKGFNARVHDFIEDMAEVLRRSDLVVSRSGSGICEIAAAGRACVLVPYPYSSYGHQDINAGIFVSAGAAVKIDDADLCGEKISGIIREFLEDTKKLEAMSARALSLAKPDAAQNLVSDLVRLASEGKNA